MSKLIVPEGRIASSVAIDRLLDLVDSTGNEQDIEALRYLTTQLRDCRAHCREMETRARAVLMEKAPGILSPRHAARYILAKSS